MALKDWKKQGDNHWVNWKKHRESSVHPVEDYWVFGCIRIKDEKYLIVKSFDNKSQALKFAKQYMGTH